MGTMLVSTYNVLADAYVRRAYYPLTPDAVLDPARRRPALLSRIEALDADLVCLQELEPAVFSFLEARLAARGFSAWMSPRPGRPDGCAILAREPVRVLSVRSLAFDDGRGGRPSGHVAQLAEVAIGERTLSLANTHLKWDPPGASPEERWSLRQAGELLATLGDSVPAIVCGDLNATPEDALLDLFRRNGFLEAHPGAPPTCNPGRRAKTIDYVLVRGARVVEPMATAPVGDLTPLPSEEEPSDHVPLLARIDLADTARRAGYVPVRRAADRGILVQRSAGRAGRRGLPGGTAASTSVLAKSFPL